MSDILANEAARRSRWIPWVFVGGMALVVVVNAGLIFASISTFTGVTVGHSYDRGRTYNHVLDAAARQAALGWQGRVTLRDGVLDVQVVDRAGAPVAGQMTGLLLRPLQGTELPLVFRATGPGHFEAQAAPPLPGQWEARLRLTAAGGAVFDLRQRVQAP
ncbi:FixH family protein [Falsiroseomonas selenitidurans]|uniref:FixH family protein n=1 Tax=Falsiroseomonas selenitidurans TaxID=2716335 RepID=A0ABX1DXB9_9PROT|nr:FixH family protein [Falsiroseomonas selenitidurans]NKC29538.1 FixH family protein [Falsiroseomonas selenitidurans]